MAKKSGFRPNPPRDWKDVTVNWLQESQYNRMPWIRKFIARLENASSDVEIIELKRELERFLDVMETGGELARDEIQDINRALIMGSLDITQSGIVEPGEPLEESVQHQRNIDSDLREPTEEEIRKALTIPDDFGYSGELPIGETWSIGPVIRTRDSNLLEQSNADAIEAALERIWEFRREYEIVHSGHWAVGWVDHLAFHAVDENREPTRIFKWILGWMDGFENYPVADDEDYSKRQYKAVMDNIKDAGYRMKEGSPILVTGSTPDEDSGWIEAVYDWLRENGSHDARRSLEDPENYSTPPEDVEAALRDLNLFRGDDKFEIRLDTNEEDPFTVTVYALDREAAIEDQSIAGSNWEAPYDLNEAYAVINNSPNLPKQLRAEGYIIDGDSEWYYPGESLAGQENLRFGQPFLPELLQSVPDQVIEDVVTAWVTVKGTKDDAVVEAMARGFGIDQNSFRDHTAAVSFKVKGSQSALAQWYADSSSEAPYPDGTLLHYRFA